MQETRAAVTTNYDAILIGSGIGALTVAVGLSRQKHWRCLILEQNFNLGGMTQEFVRERCYHFDVLPATAPDFACGLGRACTS
jgi:phytoene dehydrogenase-like protein